MDVFEFGRYRGQTLAQVRAAGGIDVEVLVANLMDSSWCSMQRVYVDSNGEPHDWGKCVFDLGLLNEAARRTIDGASWSDYCRERADALRHEVDWWDDEARYTDQNAAICGYPK
jgi:hypothetical protein